MSEQMVTTILGTVPESELRYEVTEQDEGEAVIMAREWFYTGSDPLRAEHVNKVVRRDVWATMKCGLAAQVVSEL
jgi:hypothetical protein